MEIKNEILVNSNSDTTVGILHCGDMGSAFGRLLRKRGMRVITTCEGRSHATEERARSSGIEILPTLSDVATQSDFVFSLVLPSAAVEVARQYVNCSRTRRQDSIFVDANSIGMEAVEQIDQVMAEHNIPLVDAAINGVSHRLEDLGMLHLSGPTAGSVEAICRGLLRVNCLGTRIGSASRLKLLMSGMAKGLVALFLEVGMLAERADMAEPFLEGCHEFYPSVMTVIDRVLATYPRHAARRVGEMREIEQMGQPLHLPLGMTHAACNLMQLIANVPWDEVELGSSDDVRKIIQAVAKACPAEYRPVTLSEILK
jgi:3-hydroxyisobutyrate dehydrogenase-like beta-hydroxyacid dehydrogenase